MTSRTAVYSIIAIAACVMDAHSNATSPPDREDGMARELPEVIVSSRKYDAVHLTGYMREISTLVTTNDTVLLFREKNIDFMVPTRKVREKKKYYGWLMPRVLSGRSYYRFSNPEGLDSVSDSYHQYFSWSDLAGIPYRAELPPSMRPSGAQASDTAHIASGRCVTRDMNSGTLNLEIDVLADPSNTTWVPNIVRFTDRGVDFTRLNLSYTFIDYGDSELSAGNLAGMSFVVESDGRGLELFSFFAKDAPYYVTTHARIFITGRKYLKLSDAREIGKHPQRYDRNTVIRPDGITDVPAYIADIVERVDHIDHDRLRIGLNPDKRLAGIDVTKKKKKESWLKSILSSIFH